MFKVGQRVVCVRLDNFSESGYLIPEFMHPKIHEVVTIEEIEEDGFLLLAEYSEPSPFYGCNWFDPTCFRPFSDDFADEVLRKITEDINAQKIKVL